MEVEVFIRVDVFFSVSLGIGRKDRHELAGLHALKRALEQLDLCVRFGVSQAAESLRFQMNKVEP